MADRATLHFDKLDDFAAWASGQGFQREPHKAEAYEVLRLRRAGKPPMIFYRKLSATQHATCQSDKAHALVRRYVNAKKRGEWPK